MGDREEYLELLKKKEENKLLKEHQNKEVNKELNKLSWIKQLQYRDKFGILIFKDKLERLELNQKWAFEYVVKQYYTELKDNWEEEFNHFFTELLNEEVKSINDYMKKHNYRKEETESFIKS
jgi:hypothetical protein